jgi:hypothetical protein
MADIQKGVGERTGNVAHDAPDSGNPMKMGGRVRTTLDTAVAEDDRHDAIMSTTGGLLLAAMDGATVRNLTMLGAAMQVTGGLFGLTIRGDQNHDAVEGAFSTPIKIGGRAGTVEQAAVADNDRVEALFSTRGGLVIAGIDTSIPRNLQCTGNGRLIVEGSVPHSGPNDASSGVLQVGGHASAALLAAVTESDRVRASYDLQGQARITAEPADPVPMAITTTADALVKPGDSTNDAIRVNIVAGGGSGGTSQTDNAAFTGGSTAVTPMGAIFDATPPTITDGSVGAPRMDSNRMLFAKLTDGTDSAIISAAGALSVELSAGIAGDIAHDAADSGNPSKVGGRARSILDSAVAQNDRTDAIFSTTGGALSAGVDGTNVRNIAVNASGQVEVDIAAQQSADVTVAQATAASLNATVVQGTAANLNAQVAGDIAHSAIDSGNPIKLGGRGRSVLDTAVATDDRVNAHFTTQGGLLIAGVDGSTVRHLGVNSTGQLEVDISAQQGGALDIQGDVAHDAVDSGNPIKLGGRAGSVTQSAVAVGDRVEAAFSLVGAQLIAGIGAGALRSLALDVAGRSQVVGSVAHDDPDAGDPVGIGFNAVEFNADPPTVSADSDRVRAIATPQGIQWALGGHPNIITREYMTTAAQTNDPIIDTVAGGSQIVVTEIEVLVSAATSVTPQVRIGFGATAVPTEPASGASVDGVALSHPGIAAGSGVVRGNGGAAIAIGADGAELRITNSVPTGGQITVLVSYYVSTL